MKTILEKIRLTRQLRGYSHEYIAQALDISQAAYSKIESGKTQLTIQRLFQIAEILEASIFDLLNTEIINRTQYLEEILGSNIIVKDKIIQKQQEEIDILLKMLSDKK